MSSLSKRKLAAVDDAIRTAYMAVLDEFFPKWSDTPPDQMTDQEKWLFDAVSELERQATRNVREVLA
jgi:hypothetical protein